MGESRNDSDEGQLGWAEEGRRVLRHPQAVEFVALRRDRLEESDGEARQDEEDDETADRHGDRRRLEPAVGRLDLLAGGLHRAKICPLLAQ
jgi:hypothetical protein